MHVAASEEISDAGLSLEELGQTLAGMMQAGLDPYQPAPEPQTMDLPPAVPRPEPAGDASGEPATSARDDACDVSPRTILEAMLFVGHPHNQPLTSQQVASLMRGVLPEEIDELVRELNEEYAEDGAPYSIVAVDRGYQLRLHEAYAGLYQVLAGRTREVRLSQAAIDILAIVAYQQPITRQEIDRLRGKASGGMLAQLVRRDLLRVERTDTKPRELRYYTTDRFLRLFGLDSLDDLPRSQDLDRQL